MKFREKIIKIGAKNVDFEQKYWKFTENVQILQNVERCLRLILQMKAVQKCENLVDLEKIMLKNAYLGAKIGFDTEENELWEICDNLIFWR